MSASVKNVLEVHQTIVKAKYDDLSRRMQNIQLKSMFILNHIDEKERAKNQNQRALKEIVTTPASICKPMMERAGAIEAFNEGNTPRMYIKDFCKSPFALRAKPITLQFYDFEAEITADVFSKVPS